MKKTVLVLASVTMIAFTSCKKEQQETVTEESTPATEQVMEKETNTTENSSEIPNFESAELTSLAKEFATIIDETINASKTGDVQKLTESTQKVTNLLSTSKELLNKVSKEDLAKWQEYSSRLQQKLNIQ
ncbi:MAG: hypothetical protein H6604_08805 [Flavobacteriales bacterium]|nr:hypothetical protein [Flavobacteriales bacterium]